MDYYHKIAHKVMEQDYFNQFSGENVEATRTYVEALYSDLFNEGDDTAYEDEPCDDCNGTGYDIVMEQTCLSCGGAGIKF